jgi:hypothetical protein
MHRPKHWNLLVLGDAWHRPDKQDAAFAAYNRITDE